jgi:hypothetical protein
MADRLGAIGGTVELVSAPGEGTVLTGRIPVPAGGADAGGACPAVPPLASRPTVVTG